MRKLVPAGNGVPPGKSYAWANNDSGQMIYGYVCYDNLAEALNDIGSLLVDSGGRSVTINYKEADESNLHIYELKRIAVFPKQEPMNFSWLNPKNWF